jgi:hypothetical protein
VAIGTGDSDSIGEAAFGIGSGLEGQADSSQRRSVSDVGLVRFVVLPCCELVGRVEDLLGGTGHRCHLRYLGLAAMAWTMIGPSVPSTTPISIAGVVGSDEHGEPVLEVFGPHRVVERVEHRVVRDAVYRESLTDARQTPDGPQVIELPA